MAETSRATARCGPPSCIAHSWAAILDHARPPLNKKWRTRKNLTCNCTTLVDTHARTQKPLVQLHDQALPPPSAPPTTTSPTPNQRHMPIAYLLSSSRKWKSFSVNKRYRLYPRSKCEYKSERFIIGPTRL